MTVSPMCFIMCYLNKKCLCKCSESPDMERGAQAFSYLDADGYDVFSKASYLTLRHRIFLPSFLPSFFPSFLPPSLPSTCPSLVPQMPSFTPDTIPVCRGREVSQFPVGTASSCDPELWFGPVDRKLYIKDPKETGRRCRMDQENDLQSRL